MSRPELCDSIGDRMYITEPSRIISISKSPSTPGMSVNRYVAWTCSGSSENSPSPVASIV